MPLRLVVDDQGASNAMLEVSWRGHRYRWPVRGRTSIQTVLTSSGLEAEASGRARGPAGLAGNQLEAMLVAEDEVIASASLTIGVQQRRVDLLLPAQAPAEPGALEVLAADES